jgi:prevent-host-death family protein
MYIATARHLYTVAMDVAVTELRAHLSDWLARARDGDEIVVTDRGIPVARLLGVDAATTLVRLTEEGVIARPNRERRPLARGRTRPRPRRPVAEIVSDQRG